MHSVMLIYRQYVEDRQLLTSVPLYWLSQDPLEILFGRCRAMNGFNDNPTAQQFMGAFRKLMAFDAILCSSSSNCAEDHTPAQPFASILYVTSVPSTSNNEDNEDVSSSQLGTLYQKLSEIEAIENSSLLDSVLDYSIAFISAHIERRIVGGERMYWNACKDVFKQNDKLQNFGFKEITTTPCRSTLDICKQADRFLKIQLIRSCNNFNVMSEGIYNQLDIENLYRATDFSHNNQHNFFFIRSIIDVYIQIKATYIAKNATSDIHKENMRSKLHKLVHNYGQ